MEVDHWRDHAPPETFVDPAFSEAVTIPCLPPAGQQADTAAK
jgi:hypothetical protein